MGIKDAVSTCFSKYATFSGRATRPEFWWFYLFIVIMYIVLAVLGGIIGDPTIATALIGIFGLAIIIPIISVTVRRLHDQDKSGAWYWIALVPAVVKAYANTPTARVSIAKTLNNIFFFILITS